MQYLISEQEFALLEAAKAFTRVFGHADGTPVTHRSRQEEGKTVLIKLVEAGSANADGGYVRDLPPPMPI